MHKEAFAHLDGGVKTILQRIQWIYFKEDFDTRFALLHKQLRRTARAARAETRKQRRATGFRGGRAFRDIAFSSASSSAQERAARRRALTQNTALEGCTSNHLGYAREWPPPTRAHAKQHFEGSANNLRPPASRTKTKKAPN